MKAVGVLRLALGLSPVPMSCTDTAESCSEAGPVPEPLVVSLPVLSVEVPFLWSDWSLLLPCLGRGVPMEGGLASREWLTL